MFWFACVLSRPPSVGDSPTVDTRESGAKLQVLVLMQSMLLMEVFRKSPDLLGNMEPLGLGFG
jgi:hypothetical protein